MNEFNQTILSLLPYSSDTDLINKKQKIDILYFIQLIIRISTLALEEFVKGNLAAFDAQVGENLCQIRAYKILNLGNKWLKSSINLNKLKKEIEVLDTYSMRIEEVIGTWEHVIKHSFSYNKELDGPEKILPFLDRHNLLIPLEMDFLFIICCYFLTYFNIREEEIPVAIDLKRIAEDLNISKHRAKRLTHIYQKLICQVGCDFILQIFKKSPSELSYEIILTQLYKISDEERMVLPCFLVSEAIFYHSIQTNIPVLLIVRNTNSEENSTIYFLFVGDKNKKKYILVSKVDYLSSFCLIVKGVVDNKHENITDYIHRVLEDPLKLILANTASHVQYSGRKLEDLRHDPYSEIEPFNKNIINYGKKFNEMKRYASDVGCSKENQKTFFLQHIYANELKKELAHLYSQDYGINHDAYQFSLNKNKIRQKILNYM